MKKIYKLLLLTLLTILPINVYAGGFEYKDLETCKRSSYFADLSSSSGVSNSRGCYEITCTSIGATKGDYPHPYTAASGTGVCANGNIEPWKSTISYGYTGVCSSGKYSIFTYGDATYDCNRTRSGAQYVRVTQPPATQPPATQPPYVPPVTQAPYVPPVTQAPKPPATSSTTTSTSTTSSTTTSSTSKTTTIAVSSDASVKKIVINKQKTITPEDNSTMNLQIPYSLEKVDVEVTTRDKNAKVKVEGNKSIGSEGGVITVTVTSSDGTTQNIITFNVSRYTKEQGDCTVAKVIIKGYDFDFSTSKEQYTIDLKNNEKSLDISVTTSQPEANYVVQGNKDLKNNSRITIVVNAEDGTECSYQITVKKSSKAWIYFILIIVIAGALFFVGMKLKDRLTQGTGKYKYE